MKALLTPGKRARAVCVYEDLFCHLVIDLGVSGKPICDFLLVIVTLAVSATVVGIFTFKYRKLLILPTPPLFDATAREEPLRISGWNLPRKK